MFNLYFVHGWGFEESFWLPVSKILDGKKNIKSINFISLNFFESEKKILYPKVIIFLLPTHMG